MPAADEVYVHCDKLENLPELNRENWLWESDWLCENLKEKATILQVGSCEGSRIIDLMKRRPDFSFTGIEIDPILHEMALAHFKKTNTAAKSFLGDITDTTIMEKLPHYDYCLCLNNTIGYIPEEEKVLSHVQQLADTVIISAYGEKFTDDIARSYFDAIALSVEKIEDNIIHVSDFSSIKRFRRADVETWGGKIIETPLGYLCVM